MALRLGMSPGEVLEKHSSLELEEWMAYERVVGPIDDSWDKEILAQIHELLQYQLDVSIRASGGKKGWKVERVGRPWPDPRKEAEEARVPKKTEAQKKAEREAFYKSLEDRNRRRGITQNSVRDSIAKK